MKTKAILTITFVLALGGYTMAQQLVYTPKNPAFGGDPFVGNWLLSTAQEQNSFQDDGFGDFGGFGGLDSSLDNQLLNRFGEGGLPSTGTSSEGNFEIEAFESPEGLIVNILDILTGAQTQVVVPNN